MKAERRPEARSLDPVVDDGLELIEPPARVPALGAQAGALALAGTARDASFLVEGARAAAAGRQNGRLERIVIGGRAVAADLEAAGVPVNVLLAPGLARRERVEESGTRLETVLAAPALPLLAVQWASPTRPAALTLSLTVLPEATNVTYRAGRGCVAFAPRGVGGSADPDQETVVVALSPAPRSWSVCRPPGGGARLTAELDPVDIATLLVSAGRGKEVRAALTAAAHLGAHARRAAEGVTEGLTVVTGSSDVDDAVPWARTRVRASLQRLEASEMREPDAREEVFWSGLGAAAAGDAEAAERALELLEHVGGGNRAAILAARVALVFGRQSAALRHAGELLGAGAASSRPGSAAMRRYALESLADALRYAAPESTIEELRAAARRPRPGGGRLPVVGGGPTTFASWLARALSGAASEDGRRTTGHRSMDAALTAWAAFRGEPDVARAAWGIHAARGLTADSGPGTWDVPDRTLRVPGRTAGALLAALAHGFLRLVPDAPVGRLRLGPCVGDSLRRFRADGIVLGGALLRLDYERDGRCHRFALSAVGARVPPVVVFDPLVRGRVGSARVDGASADLEIERLGAATRAPVQLSLDATRTVELVADS